MPSRAALQWEVCRKVPVHTLTSDFARIIYAPTFHGRLIRGWGTTFTIVGLIVSCMMACCLAAGAAPAAQAGRTSPGELIFPKDASFDHGMIVPANDVVLEVNPGPLGELGNSLKIYDTVDKHERRLPRQKWTLERELPLWKGHAWVTTVGTWPGIQLSSRARPVGAILITATYATGSAIRYLVVAQDPTTGVVHKVFDVVAARFAPRMLELASLDDDETPEILVVPWYLPGGREQRGRRLSGTEPSLLVSKAEVWKWSDARFKYVVVAVRPWRRRLMPLHLRHFH